MKRVFPFLLLIFLTGCGSGMGTLSGTVSIDGKPVENGRIEFVPVDGQSATFAAKIIDGAYKVEAPKGEKFVRLYSFVETGRYVPRGYDMEVIQTKQVLPENLNARSEIKLVVTGGKQKYNYP